MPADGLKWVIDWCYKVIYSKCVGDKADSTKTKACVQWDGKSEIVFGRLENAAVEGVRARMKSFVDVFF